MYCKAIHKPYKCCPICIKQYGEEKSRILEGKKEEERAIARNNSKKKRAEVEKNEWKMSAPQPTKPNQKQTGESSSTNSNRYTHIHNKRAHVTAKKIVCEHNQQSLAVTHFKESTTVSGHFGMVQAVLEPLRDYVGKNKSSEEIKHPLTQTMLYNSATSPYASITFINEGNHPVNIHDMNYHNLYKLILDLVRGDALKSGKGKFNTDFQKTIQYLPKQDFI